MSLEACDARARLALGFDPGFVGISHVDQVFIDHVLCMHPMWINIIEFGTYTGVSALILGLTARCRGGRLWTIDNAPAFAPNHGGRLSHFVQRGWLDNMSFQQWDLLPHGNPNPAVIELLAFAGPMLLVVDGGNKPEEVRLYAPHLRRGCGLIVHDTGATKSCGEITYDELRTYLPADQFAPVCEAEAQLWGAAYRCFERIAE